MSNDIDRLTTRRIHFRVRTLFVVVAIIAALLGAARTIHNFSAHRQRRLVDLIRRQGGRVKQTIDGVPAATPPSWRRSLLGEPFTQVHDIDLSDTQVSDNDLRAIAVCRNLRTLDLSRTRIRGTGLQVLRELPYIEELSLEGTTFSDEFLAPLRSLTQLRTLNLKSTRITSSSLHHLSGLRQLEAVYLDETEMDDAGLRHLETCTNLTTLTLEGTRVTAAGLSQLQKLKRLSDLKSHGLDLSHSVLLSPAKLSRKLAFVNRTNVVHASEPLNSIRNAWRHREQSIESFDVESTIVSDISGTSTERNYRLVVDGHGRTRCELRSRNGKLLRLQVFDGEKSSGYTSRGPLRAPMVTMQQGRRRDWYRDTMRIPYGLAYRPLSTLGPQKELATTTATATVAGSQCLVMYHSGGELYVDPARNFLPLRITFQQRGRVFEQFELAYKQAGTDWNLTSWTRQLFDHAGRKRQSEHHTVSRIQSNEAYAGKTFKIEFPPDIEMLDQDNDRNIGRKRQRN